MRLTRIVLAGMPSLMLDIVDRILADIPGLRVVAHASSGATIAEAVRRNRADLVIVGAAEEATAPARLFRCHPTAVLEVGGRGGAGTVWVLRPQARSIGELSAASLAEAISFAMSD